MLKNFESVIPEWFYRARLPAGRNPGFLKSTTSGFPLPDRGIRGQVSRE
jgi:hypothetical protein